jgi:hypothetical protein
MKMKWTKRSAALALLGGAVALGAAAMTVTVNSAQVILRAEPDQFHPSVAIAKKGATLDVMATQGAFQKVKFGEKTGWIRTADLQPRKYITPSDTGTQLANNSTAGSATESASGKGIGDGINDIANSYSASSGVSVAGLEGLMAQRKEIIDSGRYIAFARQGNVGKR